MYVDNELRGTVTSSLSSTKGAYAHFALETTGIPDGTHTIKIATIDYSNTFYVDYVAVSVGNIFIGYIGTTTGLTSAGFSSDDGSTSHSIGDMVWYYNGVTTSNIYVSGNSWLGFDSASEHVKVNRRDTYVSNYYYGVITLANGLVAHKVAWTGWSPYNSKSSGYLYTWEVFLLENGDAMINLASKAGSTTWDGTFNFCGASFTLTSVGDMVSFYRTGSAGTSSSDWEVESGIYNPAHSHNVV